MSESPGFLPPILELEGTWEEILDLLYCVFVKDFKVRRCFHKRMPVYYDGRVFPEGKGKEEGFWHVISRIDYSGGERLPDFRRAERLPWARPLMESPDRVEIKVFDHEEGPKDKGIRRYIWLENHDYVLIFQKKKVLFWITAFYIDKNGQREDLRKRYEERVQ
ncbi:MAG: hypothetical protein NT009_09575 [Proteobacteria bacterium]|nr:hypothetical protein [Pseudomonadota bacterium]